MIFFILFSFYFSLDDVEYDFYKYERFLKQEFIKSFYPIFEKSKKTNLTCGVKSVYNEDTLILDPKISLDGKLLKDLYFYFEIFARKTNLDSIYPFKEWNGILRADYLRGMIFWKKGKFTFGYGRDKIKIGFGENLLLVNFPYGFDHFRFVYSDKNLNFYYVHGYLGDRYGDAKRYWVLHRVEYLFRKISTKLAFSEVSLYGGKYRNIDWYYLNPFFLYYVYQWNYHYDDNYFWDIEILSRVYKKFYLRAEFLIDDYQYSPPEDSEPNEIGYVVESYYVNKKFYFNLGYLRILKWTYNYKYDWGRYLYQKECIGYQDGNDLDKFFVNFRYFPNDKMFLGLKFIYKRKGEGDIEDKWPEDVFPREDFPSGNVKFYKKYGFELGLKKGFYNLKCVLSYPLSLFINLRINFEVL